ncbi:MAG: class I SAM-dependent methyltransferase [Verrucomicrobiota bacterium]|nr:class I SAM-dependent methyltransferase [Verrucomicrobiota bacterium]
MENRFEERYRSGDLPWDHGMVDANLIETIDRAGIKPCRVLDIGCGTGDNAVWLAGQGFDVVACDLSETAIELAREKIDAAGAGCSFLVADFLADEIPEAPFGFVVDRGCLHCMQEQGQRAGFVEKVAGLLEEGGCWLSLVGNADEPGREVGPPRLTATELVAAAEPFFEIQSLETGHFGSDQADPPRAWICLMKKRA